MALPAKTRMAALARRSAAAVRASVAFAGFKPSGEHDRRASGAQPPRAAQARGGAAGHAVLAASGLARRVTGAAPGWRRRGAGRRMRPATRARTARGALPAAAAGGDGSGLKGLTNRI